MTTLPHPLPNGHFRALREHLGLTTQWVAEQVGFNHRTVRRWDNGESAVPPRVVTQLRLWKEQTDAAVDELVLSHQQGPRALTVPLKEPPTGHQQNSLRREVGSTRRIGRFSRSRDARAGTTILSPL